MKGTLRESRLSPEIIVPSPSKHSHKVVALQDPELTPQCGSPSCPVLVHLWQNGVAAAPLTLTGTALCGMAPQLPPISEVSSFADLH